MIRQEFDVESYYKVIVYYDVNFDLFMDLVRELSNVGASASAIWEIYDMMSTGKAKAVTFSNVRKHISVVLFNPHDSKEDYINSIVHEAEHVKQAMLEAYNVKDEGEPPAYTIGYLISRMYRIFADIICERC